MSKKLLVAYDEVSGEAGQGDFLCVVVQSERPAFWGLRSRRIWSTGLLVYMGKNVAERDLFTRLIDSGRKIENVQRELARLSAYVKQLDGLKIGNVVSVQPTDTDPGFELVKVAEMPRSTPKKLP